MINKVYGYCRISTSKQSIERQVRNILKIYPDAIIFQEAFSGRKMDRPQWIKLCQRIQPGDTIVFDSVSRMSRSAEEGFTVYEELYRKDISLEFIKEPHINTKVYRQAVEKQQINIPRVGDNKTDDLLQKISEALNEYLLDLAREQIRLAFEQSEKEVSDLRQRTREGLETARRNGKQIGQKKGRKLFVKKKFPAQQIILKHSRTFGGSLSDKECMKLAGISEKTYYLYKKELYHPEARELCMNPPQLISKKNIDEL